MSEEDKKEHRYIGLEEVKMHFKILKSTITSDYELKVVCEHLIELIEINDKNISTNEFNLDNYFNLYLISEQNKDKEEIQNLKILYTLMCKNIVNYLMELSRNSNFETIDRSKDIFINTYILISDFHLQFSDGVKLKVIESDVISFIMELHMYLLPLTNYFGDAIKEKREEGKLCLTDEIKPFTKKKDLDNFRKWMKKYKQDNKYFHYFYHRVKDRLVNCSHSKYIQYLYDNGFISESDFNYFDSEENLSLKNSRSDIREIEYNSLE